MLHNLENILKSRTRVVWRAWSVPLVEIGPTVLPTALRTNSKLHQNLFKYILIYFKTLCHGWPCMTTTAVAIIVKWVLTIFVGLETRAATGFTSWHSKTEEKNLEREKRIMPLALACSVKNGNISNWYFALFRKYL